VSCRDCRAMRVGMTPIRNRLPRAAGFALVVPPARRPTLITAADRVRRRRATTQAGRARGRRAPRRRGKLGDRDPVAVLPRPARSAATAAVAAAAVGPDVPIVVAVARGRRPTELLSEWRHFSLERAPPLSPGAGNPRCAAAHGGKAQARVFGRPPRLAAGLRRGAGPPVS
jgi:hypothetical protein